MEHMTYRTPEKAEYRKALVQSAEALVQGFPDLVPAFAQFLTLMARNAKATLRLSAVEVAAQLLMHSELMSHTSTFKQQPSSPLPASPKGGEGEPSEADLSEDPLEDKNDAAVVVPVSSASQCQLLLALLLARSSDKAANVRARSLVCLTLVLHENRGNSVLPAHFQSLASTVPATPSAAAAAQTNPTGMEQVS